MWLEKVFQSPRFELDSVRCRAAGRTLWVRFLTGRGAHPASGEGRSLVDGGCFADDALAALDYRHAVTQFTGDTRPPD